MRGFSLIQVIVAMGLMSVLMLSLLQMNMSAQRTQRGMAASQDILEFQNELRNFFSKEGVCLENFEGQKFSKDVNIELTELKKADGVVKYRLEELMGNNTFRIKSMRLANFDPDIANGKAGTAEFILAIEKNGQVYGAKERPVRLLLNVTLDDSGQVLSCSKPN